MKAMSAWSAHPAKRLATGTVAALTVVALLGGCGFATRQQAAAVVNGVQISESDVQTTVDQLHTLKQFGQVNDNVIVEALVTARLLKPQIEKSGDWKPDDAYASIIAQLPGATDMTKEIVEYVALLQSQKVTEKDIAGLQSAVNSAHITVNPKFGVFQRTTKPPFFDLAGPQPNWLKPTATAAAK